MARAEPDASDLDVGLLFCGREELPITQSALLPLFDRCPITRSIDLAIVMEPTANAIEVGCLGNLNVRIEVRGVAAHTARPWLGHNAIHSAIGALTPIAERPPRDVKIDGLVFREVVSVTSIEGGHRRQRHPGSGGGDRELPVRADADARRGGAAPA